MADGDELRGVGGWLGFFVVVIAILSPLRLLVTGMNNLYGDPAVAAAYGNAWPILEAAEWAIMAIVLAGFWFITWRLLKVHNWRTVRITIAGIWLLAIGSLFIELLAVSLIAGIPVSDVSAGMTADMIQPLIFCTIWTAYFLRSKRVANTYPRHGEADEVAGLFS